MWRKMKGGVEDRRWSRGEPEEWKWKRGCNDDLEGRGGKGATIRMSDELI